jgi:hypothetical protein
MTSLSPHFMYETRLRIILSPYKHSIGIPHRNLSSFRKFALIAPNISTVYDGLAARIRTLHRSITPTSFRRNAIMAGKMWVEYGVGMFPRYAEARNALGVT